MKFSNSTLAVLEDGYPEAEAVCTSTARFSFNLDSLADIQPITLQKGLLRVYMQAKSDERAHIELSARIYDYPNSKTASVLTQVTTTEGSSNWVEISVTDALRTIFSSNRHLGRLEVSFQAKMDCKEQGAEAAIRLTNPLLVLFLDANETLSMNELHDFKRSTDQEESGSGDVTPPEESTECQRQPFVVDLTAFGRSLVGNRHRILHPPQVDIGFCSGTCSFPAVPRATILRFLEAPVEPCCSPEFGVLYMLVIGDRGRVDINRFTQVRVTSCSCQI